MTLQEWIDAEYRREDEPISTAITRLSADTGISYKALWYIKDGARTIPRTALQLERFTGGKVTAASLVFTRSKGEVRAAKASGDAE